MENNILADYVEYNKGNECDEAYHIWSFLTLVSSLIGRKAFLRLSSGEDTDSYFEILPNLYTCLVGKQGNGKSTAMRISKGLLKEIAPQHPLSSSIMSREQIIKFMAEEEQLRSFKKPDGSLEEVRPFAMFINELNNFLSFNPIGMVQFLTDIYDEKVYDSQTLARGSETIINPLVTIVACVVPDWLVRELKTSVISGGFCRRMIFVNVTTQRRRIPFPTVTPERKECLLRVKKRLKEIKEATLGEMKWTPEARKFYEDWYTNPRTSDDAIVAGYLETKHIQLLKVACILSIMESDSLLLKAHHLAVSLSMLDLIEPNMALLSKGIGLSKLAFPSARVVEILDANGGFFTEKKLQVIIGKDLEPRDLDAMLKHLIDTDQIVRANFTQHGVTRQCIFKKETYELMTKKQAEAEAAERAKTLATKAPVQ